MVQSTFYFSIQVASQTSKLNISIPVAHNVNKSVSQESVGQECQVIRQIVYGISLRWFTDSFHCLFNFLLLSSLNTKTCNENLTKCFAYLSVLSAMKSWFPCTMISLHHDFLALRTESDQRQSTTHEFRILITKPLKLKPSSV